MTAHVCPDTAYPAAAMPDECTCGGEPMTDPTAAERIADAMAGRAETIRTLQNADEDCAYTYAGPDDGGALQYWACSTHNGMGLGDVDAEPPFPCDKWHSDEDGYALGDDSEYSVADTAADRLMEMPLSVEVIRHVKVLLGTGGPADWLDAELDTDGEISTLAYHFADWGTHSSVYVEKDSPLWRFAESFVENATIDDNDNAYN
jgi:hypothetical protein